MKDYKVMQRLWAVSREYGIDKDMLHQMSSSEFGEQHISKLTDKQKVYLINKMQGKNTPKPSPAGMASVEQKKYIRELAAALGWDDNPARLAGFIRKYAKTDALDWLTVWQASKVIEGLKKMAERSGGSG